MSLTKALVNNVSSSILGSLIGENPSGAWWPAGATLALDFLNNRYMAGGIRYSSFSDIPGASVTVDADRTFIDASGNLVQATANTPRLDHSLGSRRLLIEELRTNLFLNSLSPATQTITISSTGNHTLSIVGSGSVEVTANTGTATGLGTATDGSPVTFNVTGTGTFDFTVTGSPDGVQVEAGSFATSIIVTAGVARVGDADKYLITGIDSAGWYTQSTGTLVASLRLKTAITQRFFLFSDDTYTGKDGWTFYANAGNQIAAFMQTDAPATQYNIVQGSWAGTDTDIKIAQAFAANDAVFYLDGSSVGTDVSVIPPDLIESFSLNAAPEFSNPVEQMFVESVYYFPARLSNTELQALTS